MAAYSTDSLSLSARYSFIQAQPQYGYTNDRQEVKGTASLKFTENWRASANAVYNIEAAKISSYGFGLRYDDECFTYGMAYSEARDAVTNTRQRTIGFNVSLRTLAEISNSTKLD